MSEPTKTHWFKRSLGTLAIVLGMTSAVYWVAVYSFATEYWNRATGDMKGWLIILFPLLLLPPLVAWAKVAVPCALAAAVPHPAFRAILALIAIGLTAMLDISGIDPATAISTSRPPLPAIGLITPWVFKSTVYGLAILGYLVSYRVFRSRLRHSGEQ